MSRLTRCFVIGLVLLLAMQVLLADNLARGKTASQITTPVQTNTSYAASYAVDGNVTTMSCTKDRHGLPWWAVDLGQDYDIGRVNITLPNASSVYINGLSNFAVGMPSRLPSAGSPVNTNSYPVCGTWNHGVSAGKVVTIDCASSTRYVIVQSLDTSAEKLCIAEVVIYRRRMEPPFPLPTRSTTSMPSYTSMWTSPNSNDSSSLISLIAGVAGGVGVLLIILIVVIVVVCLKKRRTKSKTSDVEDRKLRSGYETTTPSTVETGAVSSGKINDGYETIDLNEPNRHTAQQPTEGPDATTAFDSPPEPTYNEVTSKHGPTPRPRASQKNQKKNEAQDQTYAAIVHNKQ